ncbi:hypothetical protein K0W35_004908 [Vibrio parahaemolyticus]|nr:hypothetical protein [Vibrio parahaemolyticus]
MFNKNGKVNIQEHLEAIQKSLNSISNHLSSEEENKYRALYEASAKKFDHETQKSRKIEEKANRTITFMLSATTAYFALFVWFIQNGYENIIPYLKEGPAVMFLLLLLIVGGGRLFLSLDKLFKVMWTTPEYNPRSDFKLFHIFNQGDKTTKDVYEFYAINYSTVCEERERNNRERGDKLASALLSSKRTIFCCLGVSTLLLIFCSPIISSL